MSLDSVRSSAEAAKRHELHNAEISRKRKLRELYAVTISLAADPNPNTLDAPPDAHELQFLEENDLAKGRYFRDSTLPPPPPPAKPAHVPPPVPVADAQSPVNNAAASNTQDSPAAAAPAPTATPPAPDHASPKQTTPTEDAPQAPEQEKPEPDVAAQEQEQPPQSPVVPVVSAPEPDVPSQASAQTPAAPQALQDEPSIAPKDAAPKLPDDVAALPESEPQERPTTRPGHKARTIHLPPKEVQERRLREIEHAQERRALREKKEDEHLAATGETINGEIASSPSSFGPHSTNTSRAEQHSPATSPDEATSRRGSSFLSADQQTVGGEKSGSSSTRQEDHEHDSAAATPDAQLRFEEEQAVRHARDSIKSAEGLPRVKDSDLTAEASRVVEENRVAEDGVVGLAGAHEKTPEASAVSTFTDGHVAEDSDAPAKETSVEATNGTTAPRPNAAATEHVAPADVEMQEADAADAEQSAVSKVGPAKKPEAPQPSIPGDDARSNTLPRRSTAAIPAIQSVLCRPRDAESKDKERSKATGVVFAKQEPALSSTVGQVNRAYAALRGAHEDPDKDYLIGMFDFQAHQGPFLSSRELLDKATKTYTTTNKYASLREQQDYKILKRVYTLQHANRWSLRQMEKCAEPPRQPTFHDSLMAQMKWMRTDFREERRWKSAAARNLAEWCAEWVLSSPEKRKSLQIKATRKQKLRNNVVKGAMEEDIPSPPELIHSTSNETESESFTEDDELPLNFSQSYPPAALFSLGYDEVVAKVDDTPITERVLNELPSYESTLKGFPSPSVLAPVSNETDIVPVSQLVTAKLVPKSTEPPKKRSRYEYEEEDDSYIYPNKRPISERSNASTPGLRVSRVGLPPEQTNVALFLPENKHVRDRLHASHSFRPPSEFPMPSTSFFESRAPSQWLWDEDQRLRALVKEYQFNWSLVAASMDQSSLFTSGAERRTPWECFERWVQLEGLPGEMAKTPYFRTYQARLEAAQRTVSAQYQAAQQQAQQSQASGPNLNTPRRRTAQPIRVERRRNNRFLALIDAMRKQARKRETAQHKQQEAAKAAALRKAHEPAPVRNSVHTPQEFSRLKHDREQKLHEKQELYRQQVLAAQRNVMQQQQQRGGIPGQQGMPGGAQQRMGTPTSAPGANINGGQNGQIHPGMSMQGRPHPGPVGIQGNITNGLPVMGMPQQMQMNMQGQRSQPQDMRMAMQQRNLSQQQAQAYALQHQQQMNRANGMSGMQMGGNNIQSPAMLNTGVGQSGPKVNGAHATSPMNGMQGSAASPRMTSNPSSQGTPQPQALSSGHVPHITNLTHEIQLSNPHLSQQDASRLASERMAQKMASARQNALNAAAGATAAGQAAANAAHNQHGNHQLGAASSPYQQHTGLASSNAGSASPSGQSYQQQMRQHMMQQRTQPGQQGSPNMGSAQLDSSRSATPMQPSHSQQSHQGQHGSPRASSAHGQNQGQQQQNGSQGQGQGQGQQGQQNGGNGH
ncbi:uncharacterized protein K452DRAFT_298085 [Aplosporella prunicola CBS 121167]|uniref:Vacuolar import and degradation protein 21 n=1 Tax=Aplosporella prunicola CBS 121167 TaxID=1176127 RepID=A0A6A6BFC9_9PEZI|nr:uncharacterized protein K452DRAFT_298085 [Aplosporella prunicola CBS 121167]KAF2142083.1 hypothetical protein K452DRAFT_298085 [Aplosporella prunicola CBS 121167]